VVGLAAGGRDGPAETVTPDRADVGAGVEHHELWLLDEANPATNPNLHFMLTDVAAATVRWRSQGRSVLLHYGRADSEQCLKPVDVREGRTFPVIE